MMPRGRRTHQRAARQIGAVNRTPAGRLTPLVRGLRISIVERTMRLATKYLARRRRGTAVGILLNDGRVVPHPLRPTSPLGDLQRFLRGLAGKG